MSLNPLGGVIDEKAITDGLQKIADKFAKDLSSTVDAALNGYQVVIKIELVKKEQV